MNKYGHIRATDLPLNMMTRIRVSLNGEEVTKRCVEADDVEGYVIFQIHDGAGRPVLNPDKSEILTERLAGNVKIWEASNA
jgi:hypothetical protein